MTNTTRRQFLQAATTVPLALSAGVASNASEKIVLKQPNILFFFPDQHRYDWVGTNPTIPVETPYFDALAKRGAIFNRAICPSPVCAPSRACLASGMEYQRCRVPSNGFDYPLDLPTVYTLLRDSGYTTLGCGKFDLHKPSFTWGLDGKHLVNEWGFTDGIDNAGKWDAYKSGFTKPKDSYMNYLYKNGIAKVHLDDMKKRKGKLNYAGTFPTELSEEAYCDNWIGQNGLDLLREVPVGKPWFLQANFTGPHNPMDITKRMDKLCRDRDYPQPNRSTEFDENTHNAIRQNYSAMVENIDRWLGIYLGELEKRGEIDNTIIVFSSDHGDMLGDHNLWAKNKPHQPSIGVPLAMAGPGINQGIVSDALVTTLDLTSSFLSFAGLETPTSMDSRSLIPLLNGQTSSHREVMYSALGQWRLVMDNRYKLVTGWGKKNETLLFDMLDDPLENTNIASKAEPEVKRLIQALNDV